MSRPAAAGQQGEESRLTPAAMSALKAAVLSALRGCGEFDAGCLQRAMDEGMTEGAIRDAYERILQMEFENREARARDQRQQQMQQEVGPAPPNDATCTTTPVPGPATDGSVSTGSVVGTLYYPNGCSYEGELKDGNPHGRGIIMLASGAVRYDGEFKEGVVHKGTMTYDDGDVYEGGFVDGFKQGKGICRYLDGAVYNGEWTHGKKHGTGTETFANGDCYKGLWIGGVPHGEGTYKWNDGNSYEGQWVEGKQHGKGTARYPSGEVIEGNWADGKNTRAEICIGNAIGEIALGSSSTSSPATTGARNDASPSARGAQPPGKQKRVYIERQLRSQSSQQRRFEKSTASKQFCQHCGVDDGQYKLRVCSGCNLALYCSAACQNAARGSHQRICDIISQLPPKNSYELDLTYDKDNMVDLDAGLRYATKYMDNLKRLEININGLDVNDTYKLSGKRLSSLFRSKKGALDSVTLVAGRDIHRPGISINGDEVWKELRGLKQLRLMRIVFDVQPLCDIIGQQRNTLMVLGLPELVIDWSRAKCRRAMAHAVSACKHLVKLDLQGCVFVGADLKVMLHDLPNLRSLDLSLTTRRIGDSHEFTDNTCGLIARKCPGLQELSLSWHEYLSVRGLRKIFEGCPHLRAFHTTTLKLNMEDVQILLDIAPQLLCLTLNDEVDLLDVDKDEIIEVTGGRTLLQFIGSHVWMPQNVSVETREMYFAQLAVWGRIESRKGDFTLTNEWEIMLDNDGTT